MAESESSELEKRPRGRPKKLKASEMEVGGIRKFLSSTKIEERAFVSNPKIARSPVRITQEEKDSDISGLGREGADPVTPVSQAEGRTQDSTNTMEGEADGEKTDTEPEDAGISIEALREEIEGLRAHIKRKEEEENRRETENIQMKERINCLERQMEKMKYDWQEEMEKLKTQMDKLRQEQNIEQSKEINETARDTNDNYILQGIEQGTILSNENEKVVESTGNIYSQRKYMKDIPEELTEREYEWEMKERTSRKKNIFIRGFRTVGKGIKEEISEVIQKNLNLQVYIQNIRAVGGGLLLELESMSNKIEIMKRKTWLKGQNIWIEDDFTEREKEVKSWLSKIAEEEKENGLQVKVGHMKIRVDGVWYRWEERQGRLEEDNSKFFRHRRQEGSRRSRSSSSSGGSRGRRN